MSVSVLEFWLSSLNMSCYYQAFIDNGYDVPELAASLDAIHLMSYDMHGSWENFVDHHGKLYGETGDDLTVDEG